MKRNLGKLKKCLSAALITTVALTQVLMAVPSVSAASTNLALGKSITSNNYTQNYTSTNANDGNTSTYWEGAANTYPNTLTVDLGTAQSINQIAVLLPPSWGARTQTFSVLTSTDNSTYNTAVPSNTYTFDPAANTNTVTVNVPTTTARYVRLSFTANSGATGGQVAEFQVFGTGTGGSGTPDLVVTGISESPANPTTGAAVTFSATVLNQGTGATPAGTIVGCQFQVDGTEVSWSDTDTTSLAAGSSVTLKANNGPSGSATWMATAGSHTILAWVDDVNRIAESNENNNQYSTNLTVNSGSSLPDLLVTGVTTSPVSPATGSAVSFTANVMNQGTAAGAPGTVSFSVDGTQVTTSANNTTALEAGSSTTISGTGTWTATSGTHTIAASVDINNITAESNESNNSYSTSLTIGSSGGQPDLIVTGITSNPASPLTGNAVIFSATIKNQGTGATPAGTIVGCQFEVDGTEVSWSDTDTSSLAAGASVTLTANNGPSGSAAWTATTGNHTILAWVDDVNRIAESNENNNQYSISLGVAASPMPDLVVTSLTYTPTSPVTGNTVTLTATIKNQGTAAGAPGITAFAVDGTQVSASSNNTTALAVGGTTTVTGTWTASTVGNHSVTATVDNANTTAESNETNNTDSTTITVTPQPGIDFVVTGITYTPQYPSVGSAVTFSATVQNQGTVAGAAGTVTFSVDGTQVAAANSTASIAAGSSLTITASSAWMQPAAHIQSLQWQIPHIRQLKQTTATTALAQP
jgi:subtilase family serine protease